MHFGFDQHKLIFIPLNSHRLKLSVYEWFLKAGFELTVYVFQVRRTYHSPYTCVL